MAAVELSIFLLIFEWALQQCSAAALPVMYQRNQLHEGLLLLKLLVIII